MNNMFTKYKAGQKVRIINQTTSSSAYRNYFNNEMVDFSDKIVTLGHESSPKSWRIEEDNRCWSWSEDMFNPIQISADMAFKLYVTGAMSEVDYQKMIHGED